MPHIRRFGATTTIVAALLLAFTSVAVAQPGQRWFGPRQFDNVWIDTAAVDEYTAPPGSRDKIVGLAGDDILDGRDKRDLIRGDRGRDVLLGGDGSDRIYGGLGNDRIDAGSGPDFVSGGYGADGINGGDGHDLIRAGAGPDTIVATDGVRDWIYCGRGVDSVTADVIDRVARNCEFVTRVPPGATE